MKRTISILITGILCFYSVSVLSQAIQIDCANDYVGIDRSPSTYYKLAVNGYTYSTRLYTGTLYTGSIDATGDLSVDHDIDCYDLSTGHISVSNDVWVVDQYGYVYVQSDSNLKKNVESLDSKSVLNKIMAIDAKQYNYKNKEELKQLHLSGKAHFMLDTINIEDKCHSLYLKVAKNDP